VHEEFKAIELAELRKQHPYAKVLVHPESPAQIIKQADVVSSTTGIINAAREMDAKEFIVATDSGIFYKMQQAAPGKIFIEAPTAGKSATCKSCAHCPWMAMNSLSKLALALETGTNEVFVEPEIIREAIVPINRLLEFSKNRLQLAGDA
jgi:quinolinate synthase